MKSHENEQNFGRSGSKQFNGSKGSGRSGWQGSSADRPGREYNDQDSENNNYDYGSYRREREPYQDYEGYSKEEMNRGSDDRRYGRGQEDDRYQGRNQTQTDYSGNYGAGNYGSGFRRDNSGTDSTRGRSNADSGSNRYGMGGFGSQNFSNQGSMGNENWPNRNSSSNSYGYEGSSSSGSYGSSANIGGNNQQGRFSGKGPKGYKRSKDRIEEEVNEALTRHPEIDASEITISADEDGEVTLSGTCDSRQVKRMVEDLVEQVSGVMDVKNELKVQSSSSGENKTGTQAKDKDAGKSPSGGKSGEKAH